MLLDAPVVFLSTDDFVENQDGWLNCIVSSKPESNFTWYRVTSKLKEITENLVRGTNFLSYRINAILKENNALYRCTADNDIGVIVSERSLKVTGTRDDSKERLISFFSIYVSK